MDANSGSSEHFTCPTHNRVVPITPETKGCPDCLAFLASPTDPAQMTGVERRAELDRWGKILTAPFDQVHERIEALVGRSVWTHEMGVTWDALLDEAESWNHPEDLRRHVVDVAADAVGVEKVYVYPEATSGR